GDRDSMGRRQSHQTLSPCGREGRETRPWHPGRGPLQRRPMTGSPTTPAAQLLQQGLFHHRQGQIAEAMERYTEVLRNDPENADALYYVAVVACQEGQFQQGIDLARRALAFAPNAARTHNLLGKALEQLGQPL